MFAMISFLPFTLFSFLLSSSLVLADTTNTVPIPPNGNCSQSNNKIQLGTLQLIGDCGPTQYCNSGGTCVDKGCRRDDFPFGYNSSAQLPPKCPKGQFCPDEGDNCLPMQTVGQPCQLNRDDECQAPPNFQQLAGTLDQNFNGSICLKTVCMFANITQGQDCIVDNTPFTGYAANGDEFIDIVSRGNCQKDLYCDAPTLKCLARKDFGAACTADKECSSDNCLPSLTCGLPPNAPKHFATWVYAVVGIAILGGMSGTLIGLFFIHARTRDQDREKRAQYWREQNALRQNILQMRETARSGMLDYQRDGYNSNRSSRYGLNTEDSQVPMLQSSRGGSGLRNQVSDEDRDSAEEGLVRTMSKKRKFGNKLSFGKSSSTRI